MTKKILIIDDDVDLCKEMQEVLQDEGYHVDLYHDGASAKKDLENNHHDLVILDLKISGVSGFDLMKKIKQAKTKHKVIIISGNPLIGKFQKGMVQEIQEEEKKLLQLADAVLSKPFKIESLIEMIDKLVSHKN